MSSKPSADVTDISVITAAAAKDALEWNKDKLFKKDASASYSAADIQKMVMDWPPDKVRAKWTHVQGVKLSGAALARCVPSKYNARVKKPSTVATWMFAIFFINSFFAVSYII